MKNIFINDNHQIRSGWKIVIALLSVFLVVPIILGTLLLPIFALCGFNTSDRYTLSQISIYIQEIITIIIPIILWKFLDKKNLTELGLPSIKNNHQNFIYGLLFGALSLTAAAIIILCTNSSILKFKLLANVSINDPQPDEQASFNMILSIVLFFNLIYFMSCPPISTMLVTFGSNFFAAV